MAVKLLEKRLDWFDGLVMNEPGKVGLNTKEGKDGVKEAIKFLKEQSSLDEVKYDQDMQKVISDHAQYLGDEGKLSHNGKDGSSPDDRIRSVVDHPGMTAENLYAGARDSTA